jgi:hypothetical protein
VAPVEQGVGRGQEEVGPEARQARSRKCTTTSGCFRTRSTTSPPLATCLPTVATTGIATSTRCVRALSLSSYAPPLALCRRGLESRPGHGLRSRGTRVRVLYSVLVGSRGSCWFLIKRVPSVQAFKAFAKLWKFQQEHREPLTHAGLRRWEIGEIASKVAQLYYNFYLRTSEAHFLRESFTFYEAIRLRGYFAVGLSVPKWNPVCPSLVKGARVSTLETVM